MAKFTVRPGLDVLVAQMIVPEVNKIIDGVADTARKLAPPTKTWVTVADPKVRDSHAAAHGQTIPNNLRFQLRAFLWDMQHPQEGGVKGDLPGNNPAAPPSSQKDKYGSGSSYLREPRDRSGEHFIQIAACRCVTTLDPFGIARYVGADRANAVGTKVSGKVYAQGPGVIAAEYGDEYPRPSGGKFKELGTRFMRDTVVVSARQ